MVVKSKIKQLAALTLMVSLSSFAHSNQAPEASVAESKISFWDLPALKKPFIDSTPANKNDGLTVGQLNANHKNNENILALAKQLANNELGDYDSLLIQHNGEFIFESYYKRGRINLPHFQASATKGYTGLVLARAMQLGYLTMEDLNKPLVSFLKDLQPEKFVEGAEKITLHHALNMSSGLRFTDEQLTEFRENREKYSGLAQVQAFLSLSEPITEKSQTIKYQGTDPIMVMQVIDAIVPGSAENFIKKELLDKLNINNYTWRNDHSGLPVGDARASLTSRDMLKLGALVLNDGKWQGEQLLSSDFLTKATSALSQTNEDWQPKSFFYGYLWYQTDITVADKSYDLTLTWGAGGNRIIVVDELDLVIVLTGHDREDTIFAQLTNSILPAFINNKAI